MNFKGFTTWDKAWLPAIIAAIGVAVYHGLFSVEQADWLKTAATVLLPIIGQAVLTFWSSNKPKAPTGGGGTRGVMSSYKWLLLLIVLVPLSSGLSGCGKDSALTKDERASLTTEQVIYDWSAKVNIAFGPAVKYSLQPKCDAERLVRCHEEKAVIVFLELRKLANDAFAVAVQNPTEPGLAILKETITRILGILETELLKVKQVETHYGPVTIYHIAQSH